MLLTILLAAGVAAPTTYPLLFHVAPDAAGNPVVDAAWIAEQMQSAQQIFGVHAITFVKAGQVVLPASDAALENRRDRNALGAHLKPDVINVFIVRSLRDIHDPQVMRQGVHWRPYGRVHGAKGFVRHLVIVSAQAGETVLAHELGHFFGHPSHSKVRGNLMSYTRRDTIPVLSKRQGRRMQRWGRRFVRQKELKVISAAPASPPSAR
jgi:hypothetical protein